MNEIKKLGENIAKERNNQKLLQKELAEKANITSVTLSRLETGKNATLSTLFNVAKVLKVEAGKFFNGL